MEDDKFDVIDIVIIGAGIAGLALASSLNKTSFNVLVLDRRPQMKDINRGDTLYPATVKVLEQMGLMSEIIKSGAIRNSSIDIFFKNILIENISISSVDANEPYVYTIHHENLEKSIYENILGSDNVTFDLGTSFTSAESFPNFVMVHYKEGSIDKTVKAKLLVGSDGRNSLVRKQIGIIPTIKNYLDSALIFIVNVKEGTDIINKLFIDKYIISTAPIGPTQIRISLLIPDDLVTILKSIGDEELKTYFIKINSYFKCIESITKETHFYKLIGYNLEKYHDKRVVLIGDAAHCSHPLEAHGMAQAINDSFILSSSLKTITNIDDAIEDFETKAIKHNGDIIRSQKIFRFLYQIYLRRPILYHIANLFIRFPGVKWILKQCVIRMFTQ